MKEKDAINDYMEFEGLLLSTMMNNGLTAKQAKYFIELTKNNYNEYKSALKAGYSDYSAKRIGADIRKSQRVEKFMSNIKDQINEDYIVEGINTIAKDAKAKHGDKLRS